MENEANLKNPYEGWDIGNFSSEEVGFSIFFLGLTIMAISKKEGQAAVFGAFLTWTAVSVAGLN